jgi:hypothetical protein
LELSVRTDHDGQVKSDCSRFSSADSGNHHAQPLRSFLDYVRGGDEITVPGGAAALFNCACLLSIYEAARDRRPVTIERSAFEG